MWHLTAFKISVRLSFLNWVKKEMFFFFLFVCFYHISELMLTNHISELELPTLIQRS